MKKIRVNGIDFSYEKEGKGEPIILIPGFTNRYEIWRKISPRLKDFFEVILFDHRGSGQTTTTPPPYTIELLADDLIALMDALSIKKGYMLGFSMGSAIIQMIGLKYPERILKGVLVAPFNVLPATAIMQANSTAKLFERGVSPDLVLETILPWIYSNDYLSDPKRIQQTVDDLLNDPYPQSPEGYRGQLEALKKFDLTDQLCEIQTPLLMIAGKEDLLAPYYTAKTLERLVPNGKLIGLPKLSHMLPIEAPATIIKETCAFCQSE